MENKNLQIAKAVVLNHLSRVENGYSLNDMLEIRGGNKEVLRGHIEALKNIFNDALKEMDKINKKNKE